MCTIIIIISFFCIGSRHDVITFKMKISELSTLQNYPKLYVAVCIGSKTSVIQGDL